MSEKLSPETLARLRELEKAATKGPWISGNGTWSPYEVESEDGTFSADMVSCFETHEHEKINADFIAALRNAAPALLDAAEKWASLQSRLDAAQPTIDALRAGLESAERSMVCPFVTGGGEPCGQCRTCLRQRIASLEAEVERWKSWVTTEEDRLKLKVENGQRRIATLEAALREIVRHHETGAFCQQCGAQRGTGFAGTRPGEYRHRGECFVSAAREALAANAPAPAKPTRQEVLDRNAKLPPLTSSVLIGKAPAEQKCEACGGSKQEQCRVGGPHQWKERRAMTDKREAAGFDVEVVVPPHEQDYICSHCCEGNHNLCLDDPPKFPCTCLVCVRQRAHSAGREAGIREALEVTLCGDDQEHVRALLGRKGEE